ncbi:MAG: hypothetical protein U0R80_16890 [Nocardioidaceae bacterium]
MRVFVLSTGRCGSTTFERACRHATNFTAGHETNRRFAGDRRFDYPDQHIESDNRLSWFLGTMARRFDPDETFWVHLTREPDEVATSFTTRWDAPFHSSMIRAFAHGILIRQRWRPEERHDVARFYVDTVNDNIRAFLAGQPRTMDFPLERAVELFPDFWSRIGAEGDLDAALAEFGVRHNAS